MKDFRLQNRGAETEALSEFTPCEIESKFLKYHRLGGRGAGHRNGDRQKLKNPDLQKMLVFETGNEVGHRNRKRN